MLTRAAAPPLVAQNESDRRKEELKAKNMAALAKRKEAMMEQKVAEATLELPAGWIRTESRSRPGESHTSTVAQSHGRRQGHHCIPTFLTRQARWCTRTP
jgi:hypothetical protein